MTTTRFLDESANGVYVIAATPFTDTGAVDLSSIDSMVDFYLSCGVTGMTILGMMGESSKLDADENRLVTKRVLSRVDGRIPVVVGASNPGTDVLVDFSKTAMDYGAAGVMVAPLATLRTEEQTHAYFSTICQRLGDKIPVALQDYPLTTTVHMSVPAIERMVDELPQIVMLKHEDCPGHTKLSRLREGQSNGGHRRISILVGNGGLYLPQELARGADGAMTGFAYPEMLVDVCRLYANGKPDAGEDLYDIYLPLVRHECQPGLGLAIRKEILRRRGAIACSAVRSPGPRLTRDDMVELDAMIARLERRLAERALPAIRVA